MLVQGQKSNNKIHNASILCKGREPGDEATKLVEFMVFAYKLIFCILTRTHNGATIIVLFSTSPVLPCMQCQTCCGEGNSVGSAGVHQRFHRRLRSLLPHLLSPAADIHQWCVCACVHACVRVCVHVCACVRVCVCVHSV